MKSDVLIADLQTENVQEIVKKQASRIAELEALVKYYEEALRLHKQRQFGAKSEKSEYDLNQVSLFNEAEFTADANLPEPKLVEVEKHYRKGYPSAVRPCPIGWFVRRRIG